MFQKVNFDLGPELLEPGTVLVRYPVFGQTQDDIDLSDQQKFLLYEVVDVNDEFLHLQLKEEPVHATTGLSMITEIIKRFEELIGEGIWWARFEI